MDKTFDHLIVDVVDDAMRDWSRPIVLARLERAYDPVEGTISTSVANASTLNAIVSVGEVTANRGMAAKERRREVLVLIRAADYGSSVVTGQVVKIDDAWFDVVAIDERAGGVLGLSLVRRSASLASGIEQQIESGAAA